MSDSSPRPVVFISAVSSELRTARDLVAKTLVLLGFDPKWQDIAPGEKGDLRGVLRKWVDESAAIIQLVGHCYGFAPRAPDPDFGRVSYTQFEALYAHHQGKPIWYIILAAEHEKDGCTCNPATLHQLQAAYRAKVQSSGELYHLSKNLEETRRIVLQLRDEPAPARFRGKRIAAILLGVLLLLALAGGALYYALQPSAEVDTGIGQVPINTIPEIPAASPEQATPVTPVPQQTKTVSEQNDKLLVPLRELPGLLGRQPGGTDPQEQTVRFAAAYAALEKNRALPPGTLKKDLPRVAQQILARAEAPAMDRASAFFASRKFAEAEAAALGAKDKASVALELAGLAAREQAHFAQALDHFRAGAALTDEKSEPLEWARVQWWIADALAEDGKFAEAEPICQRVVQVHQRVLGAEHPTALASRDSLAETLRHQRKYEVAEREHRAVLTIRERVLGTEHPETLQSRMNLALTLDAQGKDTEAEREYRTVLTLRERVLGAEHPETLQSRMNLANVMDDQGKHAEAEREYRAVLGIRVRVLGAQHRDTLHSRNNLATGLQAQGKYVEAEREHRAVLTIRERVLGAKHADVFQSCANLAICLKAQRKFAEALPLIQRAETGWQKTLGPEHPDTKLAKEVRERIEAAFVAEQAGRKRGK